MPTSSPHTACPVCGGASCSLTVGAAPAVRPQPVFDALTPQQAAGNACVVCSAPYDIPPYIPAVPVGFAESGGQVFACDPCAPRVGYVPPTEQLEIGAGR